MDEAETVLRQAQKVISERQEAALERAVKAHEQRRAAEAEYQAALMEADRVGLTPSKMAREFGVSETAVRLYIKRRRKVR